MKRFTLITLALILLVPTSVFAAKNTFSKRYKNTTIKEVLADLKETTGTRVSFKKKEVSNTRRVTVAFHNATPEEVFNELFDCEYTITKKGKKGSSYVVTKRILAQSDTLFASVPVDTVSLGKQVVSQEERPEESQTLLYREEKLLVHYRDSILHTRERIDHPQITKEVSVKETPADQGSSLQFYLGGAYSSMGYKLQDGKNLGHIGGEVSVRYAYFFTPEWGLGIGLDFSTYGSRAKLNTTLQWDGQTDTEGERYDHRAVTHNWQEDQRTYMLSIPLTVQYQHRFNDKVGIFAAIGGFVGLPLISNYKLVSGAVEHRGYYPQWNLELYDLDNHDFYTERIGRDFSKAQHNLSLKQLAAGVKVDLGVIIPLNKQLDLFAGVYGSVVCNNIQSEQHALGWQHADLAGYQQHAFMPEYQGLANSTHADAVRPWAVGIKVGLHFRPAKKAPKPVIGSDCVVLTDTTYRVDYGTEVTVQADATELHHVANWEDQNGDPLQTATYSAYFVNQPEMLFPDSSSLTFTVTTDTVARAMFGLNYRKLYFSHNAGGMMEFVVAQDSMLVAATQEVVESGAIKVEADSADAEGMFLREGESSIMITAKGATITQVDFHVTNGTNLVNTISTLPGATISTTDNNEYGSILGLGTDTLVISSTATHDLQMDQFIVHYGRALPEGVNYGPNDSTWYVMPDSTVVVRAIPAEGHYLVNWASAPDALTVLDTLTVELTVTTDDTLTATFAPNPILTLAVSDEAMGSVYFTGYEGYTVTRAGNIKAQSIGLPYQWHEAGEIMGIEGGDGMVAKDATSHYVIVNGIFEGTATVVTSLGAFNVTCAPTLPNGVRYNIAGDNYTVLPYTELSLTATPKADHYFVDWAKVTRVDSVAVDSVIFSTEATTPVRDGCCRHRSRTDVRHRRHHKWHLHRDGRQHRGHHRHSQHRLPPCRLCR